MPQTLQFGGLRIGPVFQHAETNGGGSTKPQKTIDTVVIPVGGLGSRMFPLTLSTPKNLLPLGEHSLIAHAALEAVAAGAKKIVIVCAPRDKQAYLDQFYPSKDQWAAVESKPALREKLSQYQRLGNLISFAEQAEPKGLGHAILQAKDLVDGPFGVILPDDAILNNDLEQSGLASLAGSYQGGLSIACMEVDPSETHRYGIFVPMNDDVQPLDTAPIQRVKGVIEKPKENAPSNLAIMGRYILPPKIFDILAEERIGAGNEIQLTDAMEILIEQGVPAYAAKYEGQRLDCGTPEGYMTAQAHVLHLSGALEQTPTGQALRPAVQL